MNNYNNYFPQSYVAQNPQFFQGIPNQSYSPLQQLNPAQTSMTLPTISAVIVQVENEEAALNFPVAVGETRMMMARDDSAFYVKSAYANGQYSFDIFDKRQKASAPKNPSVDYVTKEELEKRLEALLASREGAETK